MQEQLFAGPKANRLASSEGLCESLSQCRFERLDQRLAVHTQYTVIQRRYQIGAVDTLLATITVIKLQISPSK